MSLPNYIVIEVKEKSLNFVNSYNLLIFIYSEIFLFFDIYCSFSLLLNVPSF